MEKRRNALFLAAEGETNRQKERKLGKDIFPPDKEDILTYWAGTRSPSVQLSSACPIPNS